MAQQQRIGRYEILEKVGSGSQATVYRARDLNLDRIVALKVLDAKWADDPQYREHVLERGVDLQCHSIPDGSSQLNHSLRRNRRVQA